MRQLLFLILICFTKAIYCQSTPKYQLTFYTTENGLPSNGIKGLQWDEKSKFLWIGTEAGIVRFNGIDFKVFSKTNLPGSNLERVSTLTGAANGKIFAFDENKHQYNIDINKPTVSTIQENELLQKISTTIAPQQLDNKVANKIVEVSKQYALYRLSKIIIDKNNSCWIFDERKNLHYFPSTTNNASYTFYKDRFKTFFTIDTNKFVVTNSNNIQLISNSAIQNTPIPIVDDNNQPIQLPEKFRLYWNNSMRQPILIIGANAWLLSYQNDKIKATSICNQVPTNSLILFTQYDNISKKLFIGTESKGIIIISENMVQSIKNNTITNSRNAYYSQIKIDSNTILTNEGHSINEKQKSTNINPLKTIFGFRTSHTSNDVVWATKSASDKKSNALFSYNNITKELKEYGKIKNFQSVSVCKLNATYYIATTIGIGKIVADSIYYLLKYSTPLHISNEPFDLIVHNNSSLLFATCKNIVQYNVDKNTIDTLFTSNDYCIRTLTKYNDYYFAGTYGGGYFILKNGVAKAMPIDKNNFLLHTHCFVFDDKGYCWLSTNRGLFKAKLADMLNAYEKNYNFIYHHYFGKNDGMEITELNGGCSPCALKLNVNTISFPSMDGLLWANPSNNNLQLPDGNVYIDNFIVNDKIYFSTDTASILLPQNTKTLTIQLAYTAWCNKENIYIYYRLKKNDEWTALEVNAENTIRLSNLPSGSYQLQIKKVNGFDIDNVSYKNLSFIIATPWYQKWWFIFIIIVTLLSLFYGIYKIRTKNLIRKQLRLEKLVESKTLELKQKNENLEKNNTINNRLISIISHDIITPLKFLNVASKNLYEKKHIMPEDLKDETINEITTTSKELQLLSTNILNWIKYQNENRRLVKENLNVHTIIQEVLGILKSLAHQKKLTLVNNVNPSLYIIQYYEPLKILIYNLLTNAINFSETGSITISDSFDNNNIHLVVKDNGAGMSQEQIKNILADQPIVSSANMSNKKGNGLGYLIIKDLLKMMGATIEINSNKGEGTTVIIKLKKE